MRRGVSSDRGNSSHPDRAHGYRAVCIEYALRRIPGMNRSPSAAKLRTALGRKIRSRAEHLLVDVSTIGNEGDDDGDGLSPIG